MSPAAVGGWELGSGQDCESEIDSNQVSPASRNPVTERDEDGSEKEVQGKVNGGGMQGSGESGVAGGENKGKTLSVEVNLNQISPRTRRVEYSLEVNLDQISPSVTKVEFSVGVDLDRISPTESEESGSEEDAQSEISQEDDLPFLPLKEKKLEDLCEPARGEVGNKRRRLQLTCDNFSDASSKKFDSSSSVNDELEKKNEEEDAI